MSAKTCATPCSASQSCISRKPGVSISSAPHGKTNSSRVVVVCRPRLSLSRTGRTSWTVCPRSRFGIVDLPTPDEPSSTNVCPDLRNSSSSPNPCPVLALTPHADDPLATRALSAAFPRSPSHASALLHPIADRRPVRTLVRGKTQLAAGFSPAFAKVSRYSPVFPLLCNYARWHCVPPVTAAQKRFKVRIPSPSSDRHGKILPQPWRNTRPPLVPKQNSVASSGFELREG